MSSRGTLEKIVEATFRGLLICSAIYFGAKYAPYVLHVADNIKAKIIPSSQSRFTANQYLSGEYKQIPESLQYDDPQLYNAILIDRYVQQHSQYARRRMPAISTTNENE